MATNTGTSRGTTQSKAVTHREVLEWCRAAGVDAEFRADRGLYLRKGSGGAHWVFRYRSPVTGKQVRTFVWADDAAGLVPFPGATLQEARTRAAALRALIADGVDPLVRSEERRQAEALERQRLAEEQSAREAAAAAAANRLTFRQAFDRWRATDLQPVIRADGRRAGRKDGGQFVFEQFMRHVFPLIGEMPLADVRKADLLAVIDAQKAKGRLRTAAMLLGDLKQMLAFALDRDLIAADPLATVKKARVVGTPTQRERALSDAELQRLPTALAEARMGPRTVAAVWLILATGLRIGELLGAVWGQDLPTGEKARKVWLEASRAVADEVGVKIGIVDIESRTWHLPDTKNQRAHTVHLSDFALGQIERLRQYREVLPDAKDGELSPWLFPASDSRKPVCPKTLSKQLADRQRDDETRMSGRSKATQALLMPGGPWRAHDLRRTMATLLARLGFSSDVINAATNHVDPNRMTQTYIVDRREAEQRKAFDALGTRLSELGGSPSPNTRA